MKGRVLKRSENIFSLFCLFSLLLLAAYIIFSAFGFEYRSIKSGAGVVLALAAGIFFLLVLLRKFYGFFERISKKHFILVVICIFALIAAGQFAFWHMVRAYPVNDAFLVTDQAIKMLEQPKISATDYYSYFPRYSNNYFFTVLIYKFFSLLRLFGVTDFWSGEVVLNIIMIDLAVVFTFLTVREMSGRRKSLAALILTALCPTTYVWVTFCYTTTFAMAFAVISVYLFLRIVRCRTLPAKAALSAALGVSVFFGVSIRVTSLIPLLAALIYWIVKRKKQFGVRFVKSFAAAGLSALTLFCLLSVGWNVDKYVEFDYKNTSFPVTHWIMMGLKGNGTYNTEDVHFSMSLPTKSEKTQGELSVAKKRIKELGAKGLIGLAGKKAALTWGDGTDGVPAMIHHNSYYTEAFRYFSGDRNELFAFYSQVFRILTLLLIFVSVVFQIRKRSSPKMFIFSLTLLGGIIFHIFWEANAKYSVFFMPFMLVLAADGLIKLIGCADKVARENGAVLRLKRKRHFISRDKLKIAACCVSLALTAGVVLQLASGFEAYTQKPFYHSQIVLKQPNALEDSIGGIAASGKKVSQSFTTAKGFNSVYAGVNILKKNSSEIYVMRLYDEERNIIAEKKFGGDAAVQKAGGVMMKFNRVSPERAERFVLEISAAEKTEDTLSLQVWNSSYMNFIKESDALVDEKPSGADLKMTVENNYYAPYVSERLYLTFALLTVLLCLGISVSLRPKKKIRFKSRS